MRACRVSRMSNESKIDGPLDPKDEPSERPTALADPAPAEGSSAPAHGPETGAADAGPERPKKKKRKRKVAEEPSGPPVFERPRLDAQGRERPRFLLRFPQDPELELLIEAFESGNYNKVRETAPAVADNVEKSGEVRGAAEELLRRIEPDPLIKLFLAVAVALLLVVASYAYLSAA